MLVALLPKLLLPGALALLLLALPSAWAGHPTANDHPEVWVVGEYEVKLADSLAGLAIEASIGVNRITEGGTTRTGQQVRDDYNAAPDAAARSAVIAPLETQVKAQVDAMLDAMFPAPASYTHSQPPAVVLSSLAPSATGPVLFTLATSVTLVPASEGLGTYSEQEIEAVMHAGAALKISRSVAAEPGHENTFTFSGPRYANFTSADAPGTISTGKVVVRVDAADKLTAGALTVGPLAMNLRDTSQTKTPTAEEMVARSNVDILPFELNGTVCCKPGLPLAVTVSVELGAVGVSKRMGSLSGTVPSSVTLPSHLSADAIRLLRARGVVADNHLDEAEASINAQIEKDLRNSFKQPTATVATTTTLKSALAGPVSQDLDNAPRIVYGAEASRIYYDIGSDANTADAGLKAGAIVYFNVTLEEGADLEQTFRFDLPSTLAFMNMTSPVNGHALTFDVPNGDPDVNGTKKRNLPLVLGNASADRPGAEVIRNRVTVTIPDMGGLPGTTVPLNVQISAEVDSLDVPGRFPSVLPNNVRMPFLDADGLRLLVDRGVVKAEDLSNATRDLLGEVNATLLKSFPAGVESEGGFSPASLAAGAPDPWPVWFNVTSVAQHDIGEKPDRADAAFDAGAIVNTTFDLAGTKRQRTAYEVRLPTGFVYFTGSVPGASTFHTVVDASASDEDLTESVALRFGKDMDRPRGADLTVSIRVSIGKLSEGGDAMPAAVDVDAYFTSIDVGERFPAALPSNVELPFLSADGFRILRGRGVISDLDLSNSSRDMGNDIKTRLKEAFGERVNVSAGFDHASFNGTGPIHLTAVAAVLKDLGIPEPSLRPKAGIIAEVILEGGAVVKQRLNLTGLKDANLTYVVTLPPSLAFRNVDGVDSFDNRTLSLRLNGHGATEDVKQEVLFDLVDPRARTFSGQDAEIEIGLDLQLDIGLISAIQTRNADMVIELDALVTLGVIEVPADLAGQIPREVSIRYIPADVLRKLWQLQVLNESAVKQIEDEFLQQVADGLKGVAGKEVEVKGGLARAQFDEAVASPLGDRPVKLTATATIRKPLAGGPPAAALSLAQVPLDLPLQSFQNLPTTYTVVLPKGLSVVAARTDNAQDSTIEHGVQEDGRDWMKAKVLNGKTVTASMTVAVTPGLLVDKFLPWLILGGVIVVGLVALPVWGVVRLVRRGKGGGGGAGG